MATGKTRREHWGSKIGFILAASGSAIGLGNIWRFPYVTGANGGGAFLFIYLLFVFLIGLPVMLVELSIGRHGKKNPVGAIKKISPDSKWSFVGYLGVITGIGILSYYLVVAGWTLGYFFKSLAYSLNKVHFSQFVTNAPTQSLFFVLFLALTAFVVAGGISDGIEKMTKILMPILFFLMILLIVRSMTLENSMNGLKFFIIPDFSKVTGKTFIYALGQAFFSLSLGMGAMITYGSYIDDNSNLVSSGFYVVFFDTLIAVMAGFIIFPAIGGAPSKSGPGLVFVVLKNIFLKMPMGELVAIIFFALLAIAALTSTVSLMEVAVSYLIDEKGFGRKKAVFLTSLITLLWGIPSLLSLGAVPSLTKIYKGMGFLDLMDFIFGNVSLTLGSLLLCLFIIFVWKFKNAEVELTRGFEKFKNFSILWKISIGILAPLAISIVMIYILITGETLG